METQDIDSLKITITKSEGGDFPEISLEQNEWYPSIVKDIKLEPEGQYGPQLKFRFELQGEDHTIELGGETKQITVGGVTSTTGSTQGKLFEWASAILGGLEEGQTFSPKDLVGRKCYIMVKPSKGKKDPTKTFWNVEKVKSAKKKVEVAQSAPQAPVHTSPINKTETKTFQAKNPGGVTDPAQIDMGVGKVANVANNTKKTSKFDDTEF